MSIVILFFQNRHKTYLFSDLARTRCACFLTGLNQGMADHPKHKLYKLQLLSLR